MRPRSPQRGAYLLSLYRMHRITARMCRIKARIMHLSPTSRLSILASILAVILYIL
jgi:hypothetical protein